MMTKKQAEDINKIFRQNNLQLANLKKEIDSLKSIPQPKTIKGTLLLHDTVTVIDTLKLTDTVRNIVTVTDTIGPRLRGSVLLPKGDYWLYTYNEKTQRYEMDSSTLEAMKKINQNKTDSNIITIWSATVIVLMSMIIFLGV